MIANLEKTLLQFAEDVSKIGMGIAILAFIAVGIMLIYSNKMSDQAKSWGLKIGIGIIIITAAPQIVLWFQGLSQF